MWIDKVTVLSLLRRITGLMCFMAGTSEFCLSTMINGAISFAGQPFTGSLTITRLPGVTPDSAALGETVIQMLVKDGRVSLTLVGGARRDGTDLYEVWYRSTSVDLYETWSVPPSTRSLTIDNVRIATLHSGRDITVTPDTSKETSVIGLVNDLSQRPVKGAGFGTGAVALINSSGQLETVVGNVGDCVFADGTTGPCAYPQDKIGPEAPGGQKDGTNAVFTLAQVPRAADLMIFRNGLFMTAGIDYNLQGQVITFVQGAIPQADDTLTASYTPDPSANRGLRQRAANRSADVNRALCSVSGSITQVSSTFQPVAYCSVDTKLLSEERRLLIMFTLRSEDAVESQGDVQIRINGAPIWRGKCGWKSGTPSSMEVPIVVPSDALQGDSILQIEVGVRSLTSAYGRLALLSLQVLRAAAVN